MAAKDYKIDLDPEKVIFASIRRYNDGYSSANMALKMADNEYMSINYEWQGDDIPEFAMNIMDILKGVNKSKASDTDHAMFERASKVFLDNAEEVKNKNKE